MSVTNRRHVSPSVISLIIALSGRLAEASSDLPQGWIYIEREPVDSTPGVYHDSVSASFVRSEAVGFPGVVAPWAQSKAREPKVSVKRGTHAGLQYTTVLSAPDKYGCRELTSSLLPEERPGASWNFAARVCNLEQQARVESLILALPELKGGWPDSNEPNRSRSLAAQQLTALTNGTAWHASRAMLGSPEHAEATADGGFDVFYTIEGKRVAISFGRDHRLTGVKHLTASVDGK